MDKFREFIKRYQWTVACVALGVLLAILLFSIGFWKTLLLLIIVAACFFFGYTLDQRGTAGVKDFFTSLLHKDKDKDLHS